jgi:hypothetical protein
MMQQLTPMTGVFFVLDNLRLAGKNLRTMVVPLDSRVVSGVKRHTAGTRNQHGRVLSRV